MRFRRPRPLEVETFVDRGGFTRVRIVGANGERVLTGEAYASSSNAERAVERLVGARLTRGTRRTNPEGN